MGLQRVRHACLTKHMHSGARNGKWRRQAGVLTLGSSGDFYRQSHPLASTTSTGVLEGFAGNSLCKETFLTDSVSLHFFF